MFAGIEAKLAPFPGPVVELGSTVAAVYVAAGGLGRADNIAEDSIATSTCSVPTDYIQPLTAVPSRSNTTAGRESCRRDHTGCSI